MAKLILASQSQRRADLLTQIGLKFDIVPSHFDEGTVQKTNPRAYTKKLAWEKAKAVSRQFNEGIIIGVDTVVYIDQRIIGKPKDVEDAILTLKALSGRTHKVVTGLCVINKDSGKVVKKAVVTAVKFRTLNDKLINRYVQTGEPLGKAGSYEIHGKGAMLAEWIKGDYYNVVGLPLTTLVKILEKMNAT